MTKNNNVPQIRFKGFTDTWEQRKLNEVGVVIDPHPSHRAPKEQAEGIPFIGIGDVDEMGNINRNSARSVAESVYEEHHKRYDLSIPSLGLGRVASLGKVIRLRSDIGKYTVSPTMSILQFNENVNIDYIYAYMNSFEFKKQFEGKSNGSTRQSVGTEMVRILDLSFPPNTKEQQQIGAYFKNLDKVITLHQRKCETLKKLKKSMLQKMFPKNGKSVPEIRFAGFTDAWEQRELGTIIKENLKPVPKPEGEYIRLGIRSHAKGTFHEVVPAGGGLDVDTMYAVEANNLIVNITFAWEEAWAITTDEDAEKLVSHRFPQYKFNLDQYPIFYKYRFNNARMKYDLELASPGGAGRNRVLNKSAFLKIPVCIPTSYEEQQQIGSYFRNLDNLITLHQRKLETLKKLKKSMLQKMFI